MNEQNGPGDAKKSQENESVPPDLYAVRMTVTRESFAKLMQNFKLDLGCRPHPEVNPDGTATLLVYATQEQFRELQAEGYHAELGENVSATGRERQKEIGEGDRFQGGRVAPRGLGEKYGRGTRGGSAS